MTSSKLIQQHKQVRKQQEEAARHEYKTVEFSVDLKKADLRYLPKHGTMTGELEYDTEKGKKSTGQVAYFEPGKNARLTETNILKGYKTFVPDSLVVIPHPEIEYQANKVVDNWNKFGTSDDFGELKLIHSHEAHDGLTKYWKFMSNKKHSVKVGDTVQFGINFRNGIGTGISLGGDFYSYRLWCANGAVAGTKRLSFRIPHRNSIEKVLEKLYDELTNMIQHYKELLGYYREFTKVKLTQPMALEIIKRAEVPQKYLSPELFDIEVPSEDNNLKHALIRLSKNGKESTLWDLFNNITQFYTEASNDRFTRPTNQRSLFSNDNKIGKIVYASFVEKTSQLHRTMFQYVPKPVIEIGVKRR